MKNGETMFDRGGTWGYIDDSLYNKVFSQFLSTSAQRSSFRCGSRMKNRQVIFSPCQPEVAPLWIGALSITIQLLWTSCASSTASNLRVVHKLRESFFGHRSLKLKVDDSQRPRPQHDKLRFLSRSNCSWRTAG